MRHLHRIHRNGGTQRHCATTRQEHSARSAVDTFSHWLLLAVVSMGSAGVSNRYRFRSCDIFLSGATDCEVTFVPLRFRYLSCVRELSFARLLPVIAVPSR